MMSTYYRPIRRAPPSITATSAFFFLFLFPCDSTRTYLASWFFIKWRIKNTDKIIMRTPYVSMHRQGFKFNVAANASFCAQDETASMRLIHSAALRYSVLSPGTKKVARSEFGSESTIQRVGESCLKFDYYCIRWLLQVQGSREKTDLWWRGPYISRCWTICQGDWLWAYLWWGYWDIFVSLVKLLFFELTCSPSSTM